MLLSAVCLDDEFHATVFFRSVFVGLFQADPLHPTLVPLIQMFNPTHVAQLLALRYHALAIATSGAIKDLPTPSSLAIVCQPSAIDSLLQPLCSERHSFVRLLILLL